jgi:hypothetical protein
MDLGMGANVGIKIHHCGDLKWVMKMDVDMSMKYKKYGKWVWI